MPDELRVWGHPQNLLLLRCNGDAFSEVWRSLNVSQGVAGHKQGETQEPLNCAISSYPQSLQTVQSQQLPAKQALTIVISRYLATKQTLRGARLLGGGLGTSDFRVGNSTIPPHIFIWRRCILK